MPSTAMPRATDAEIIVPMSTGTANQLTSPNTLVTGRMFGSMLRTPARALPSTTLITTAITANASPKDEISPSNTAVCVRRNSGTRPVTA